MYIMKCDRCGSTKELDTLVYFPLGAPEVSKYNITYMDGDKIKQVTLCENCERALTFFIYSYPSYHLTSVLTGESSDV